MESNKNTYKIKPSCNSVGNKFIDTGAWVNKKTALWAFIQYRNIKSCAYLQHQNKLWHTRK
jgi:hypothetical protein